MIETEQHQLPLEGLDEMRFLPRCEETGQNADLHLVVYTPKGEDASVARILTTQVRELHRRTTDLSVPLWMLSLDYIERLERRGTIPCGSEAARIIRTWLRHHRDAAMRRLFEAEQAEGQPPLPGLEPEDELALGDRT